MNANLERKPPAPLTGTDNQIAWAEQIRATVNLEFDRVANALESRHNGSGGEPPAVTAAIVAILEAKRAEVMARGDAEYFIREWHELSDQVRLLLIHDPRYKAIIANRRGVSGSKKS
jgi:hypothetical protein